MQGKGCTKPVLTEQEVQSGMRNVIKDGLMTQIMSTLTGSVFLVAFAVALGASNFVIGLLATIPLLSNLVQIPTIYLVEKYRIRRCITMVAAGSSRLFLLVVGIIPFVLPLNVALPAMILALIANSILASVGGCSWNSWMHDLLPQRTLGRFFSKRMLIATSVAVPVSLGAGYFLDLWKAFYPGSPIIGYSILFMIGCIAGLIGVFVISTIPEPSMVNTEKMPRFKSLLKQPFQDLNFRNLIVFLVSWNFAINLALPFFTVYMLKYLGLDMSLVVLLTVVSQLFSVSFFRIWGKLSDRFSNKSVLRLSGPMYIASIFGWVFITLPGMDGIILPLLIAIHAIMGIGQAGVNLAAGNITLKLAPSGKATSYLASSSFFGSLSSGIAPILGGVIAQFTTSWELFFVMATAIGLLSIRWLAKVREEGEVKDTIFAHEFVCEVRHEVKNGVRTIPEIKNKAEEQVIKRTRAFITTLSSIVWK